MEGLDNLLFPFWSVLIWMVKYKGRSPIINPYQDQIVFKIQLSGNLCHIFLPVASASPTNDFISLPASSDRKIRNTMQHSFNYSAEPLDRNAYSPDRFCFWLCSFCLSPLHVSSVPPETLEKLWVQQINTGINDDSEQKRTS